MDFDQILSIFTNLNWQTIIAMFAIGWYFTKDIRYTLNKLETDVRSQNARIDRLYEMFIDLIKEGRK